VDHDLVRGSDSGSGRIDAALLVAIAGGMLWR
jgi:hypothetical protein